ncbi:MAG TPA: hypothetical protein VFL38_12150, partial [Humibacillus xanthopallidus]|nr:hypothetical protein [Humibacillus xanthopallidus]
LDAQTLPVQEWELVLAAAPGPLVSDLERVAAHRPNVRVVVQEAGEAPQDAADPMQAEGEWVLVLALDDRLERTALSQLAQLGSEAGDHDVLTVRAQTAPRGAADRAVVLTRRDGSRDSGVGERSAEVVAAEPLRRRVAPSASDPAHVLSDVTADVRWVDGALELHGRAPLHAAGAAGADLVLVGRRTGVVIAHPVDAFTVSGDDEDTEPGLLWSASVPVDANDADDIDDELEVWLEVSSSDTDDEEGEGSRTEKRKPLVGRVAAAEDDVDAPAVVQGRLVSVRSDGDGVVVDLGATGRSLLGRLDPRRATVVEDATGSLLTVEVPQLEHRSTGVVDGALVLGGVPLPARLVLDEFPRVECRLAGSPGRTTLEWSFGPGPAAPTGCEMVTSATGEFVVSAPRPETLARPVTVRRPKAPARPQATGPVAALRRRLPKGVDPVVAKLSTMPSLRGAYRRATGLW